MGKLKIKCQIGDLKIEVICYVIDADTSYNLLFGRPWIHRNDIVTSTLHQLMKYNNQNGDKQTLITEEQLFKGLRIISLIPYIMKTSQKRALHWKNQTLVRKLTSTQITFKNAHGLYTYLYWTRKT